MKKRSGIRSVRYGFNPNSSSLGADVTGLLLGGGGAMLVSVAVSMWIRLSARFGGGTPHGSVSAGTGETKGSGEFSRGSANARTGSL